MNLSRLIFLVFCIFIANTIDLIAALIERSIEKEKEKREEKKRKKENRGTKENVSLKLQARPEIAIKLDLTERIIINLN